MCGYREACIIGNHNAIGHCNIIKFMVTVYSNWHVCINLVHKEIMDYLGNNKT